MYLEGKKRKRGGDKERLSAPLIWPGSDLPSLVCEIGRVSCRSLCEVSPCPFSVFEGPCCSSCPRRSKKATWQPSEEASSTTQSRASAGEGGATVPRRPLERTA